MTDTARVYVKCPECDQSHIPPRNRPPSITVCESCRIKLIDAAAEEIWPGSNARRLAKEHPTDDT